MTYEQLIAHVRDLGFGEDSEIQDFDEVVPNAINLAIAKINLEVPGSAPRNSEYDFSVDEADEETIYIDMEDIDEDFMEFAETPMLYSKEGSSFYLRFNNFDIINESTIVLDETGCAGDFRVLYKVSHERFTGTAAQLREELPLARKVHHIVPLLVAYFVWLDDDSTKAAQYYNLYREAIETLSEAANIPRGRILEGGI